MHLGKEEFRYRQTPPASHNQCPFHSRGRGHGPLALKAGSKSLEVVLKDERCSESLAFPSALFLVGTTAFAQCDAWPIASQRLARRRMALEAGRPSEGSACRCLRGIWSWTVTEGHQSLTPRISSAAWPRSSFSEGSPGVDDTFCYFLVERDFHTGQALRRWAHGVRRPGLATGMEMKVTAKKGERFYMRSAQNFLKGRTANGVSAASDVRRRGQERGWQGHRGRMNALPALLLKSSCRLSTVASRRF